MRWSPEDSPINLHLTKTILLELTGYHCPFEEFL
mgnify:CR=1 FL=1